MADTDGLADAVFLAGERKTISAGITAHDYLALVRLPVTIENDRDEARIWSEVAGVDDVDASLGCKGPLVGQDALHQLAVADEPREHRELGSSQAGAHIEGFWHARTGDAGETGNDEGCLFELGHQS